MTTQTDLTFEYFWEVIAVKRRLMEVEFKFNNLHWKVYGLHLKSKWSDFEEDPQSDDQRRSEVLATRKRILEKQKDDALPFLIMSDLNETKGTSTIRLLQKRGEPVERNQRLWVVAPENGLAPSLCSVHQLHREINHHLSNNAGYPPGKKNDFFEVFCPGGEISVRKL